jgi:hypothetical protein
VHDSATSGMRVGLNTHALSCLPFLGRPDHASQRTQPIAQARLGVLGQAGLGMKVDEPGLGQVKKKRACAGLPSYELHAHL